MKKNYVAVIVLRLTEKTLRKNAKSVSAKYCYAIHELRLHQNDRCKRFTLV